MRTQQQNLTAAPTESAAAPEAPRRLRSMVLAWHDEESGDELTMDVHGSEQFLKGLGHLGFVPLDSRRAARPSPRNRPKQSADHRVHWTVRLVRHWKLKGR